ncbi:MOSC N-terminal beta barrel domain-containing protein [Streptomyces sp. NY05-11A]|uniref:MOSC N-terminal beta barrel domain-containing protein n=1 Tax=Streptomyces soliscabiei TaxID=588897 RepID=UPI0039F6643F
MAARLIGITYYPVKGCAGTPLTAATLTRTGLPHDRTYATADEKGDLRWQWGDPRLALITPELTDSGELILKAPGRGRCSWGTRCCCRRRRIRGLLPGARRPRRS